MDNFGLLLLINVIMTSSQTTYSESCDDTEEVTSEWKYISSPGFPSKFPAQTQCSWRLETQRNYRIKLQFTRFSLIKPDSRGLCRWQWLSIMYGDKSPEISGRKICGQDSPGTIVSSGSVIRLNLHSTAAASGQEYDCFQASFSMTHENAIMPASTQNQQATPEQQDSTENKQDNEAPKSISEGTLGSALDRLYPNRPRNPYSGLSQNERIELMNKRRNQGLPVSNNPVFLADGETAGSYTNKPPKTKPTASNNDYIDELNLPANKRKPALSNEIKTVIIVIGIISATFILILVLKECGVFRQIYLLRKEKNDEESPSEINSNDKTDWKSSQVSNENENDLKSNTMQQLNLKRPNGENRQTLHHGKSKSNQNSSLLKRTVSKKAGIRPKHRHHKCKHKHHKHKHSSNGNIEMKGIPVIPAATNGKQQSMKSSRNIQEKSSHHSRPRDKNPKKAGYQNRSYRNSDSGSPAPRPPRSRAAPRPRHEHHHRKLALPTEGDSSAYSSSDDTYRGKGKYPNRRH